jgi:hypothetical protein
MLYMWTCLICVLAYMAFELLLWHIFGWIHSATIEGFTFARGYCHSNPALHKEGLGRYSPNIFLKIFRYTESLGKLLHKYLWNFSLTVKSLQVLPHTVSLSESFLTISLKTFYLAQYLSGSIPSQYLSKYFISKYLSGSIPSQYLWKYILPRSISLEVFPHSIPLQLCKYSFTLQNSFSQYCLKRLASHNMFPSIPSVYLTRKIFRYFSQNMKQHPSNLFHFSLKTKTAVSVHVLKNMPASI